MQAMPKTPNMRFLQPEDLFVGDAGYQPRPIDSHVYSIVVIGVVLAAAARRYMIKDMSS
jgi:hypothetical protein